MNIKQAVRITDAFVGQEGSRVTASRYLGIVLALEEPQLAARLRMVLEAVMPALVMDIAEGLGPIVAALHELLDETQEEQT